MSAVSGYFVNESEWNFTLRQIHYRLKKLLIIAIFIRSKSFFTLKSMRFDKNTNYLGVDFYNHTCNTYQSKNKFRGERNWTL